ncbi:hypothetical protein AXF42_Ash009554 [Apostasia shenzhenica]|uniref:Galectin n=1 Tax=Apostasia shenzhenica TaxID=1088818 RepID=A0A2I0B963_9ASPA|nr:hypothetical protein AXF42_Ash009554 [Apostasia shenzhenica]
MVSTNRLLLSHTIVVLLLLLFFASPTSSFPPTRFPGHTALMNEIYLFAVRAYNNHYWGSTGYPFSFHLRRGMYIELQIMNDMGDTRYRVKVEGSIDIYGFFAAELVVEFTMRRQIFRRYDDLQLENMAHGSMSVEFFHPIGEHD